LKKEQITPLRIFLKHLENPLRSAPSLNNKSYEFHISRQARQKYSFDESLFQISGNVIFANFQATRIFAQKINQKRDVINFPETAVRAGEINAMGLIDEILHYIIELYREQKNTKLSQEILKWLEDKIGAKQVGLTLEKFTEDFPPLAVYSGGKSVKEYLKVKENRETALEELVLLWLANLNPAFSPFLELFDDEQLEKFTLYHAINDSLSEFFEQQPKFGPDNQNLIDMLRSPALSEPYSLSGQLDFIRRKWGFMLGKFLFRLLRSLDIIREEQKARFLGPALAEVPTFTGLEVEPERFSPDKDWMPRVVLIAKSTYVWLDQLSKKYQRNIYRLDHIPDEELDMLARWGFTGLWLIGLWERSEASRRIKQLCGNPEAVASAYSLFQYEIANDLGGEEAFNNLKHRAWQRGIRMAGDMVPNHMGIDSRWMIEHPDWFISLDYSPYPSHSFNGQNLSWDNRVGIFLEDHYYSRSDAAVLFKRVDFHTGDTKYIYHGNDGTSMPWNDTAQLNYLKPEVREAVIQTILSVARKFPIIRFDAAMTLTKKHYQRLWFPEPGSGGDIPTRSEHGLTRQQFNQAMPEEFWRELVDRVAKEIPDTLLLAEAFWLMEGYFVRTLGMHRVYNSAFMNMLKNEDNKKFRYSIKNVLEFNPEILKRYVNFMNNPDEQTAVAQFGKGDKYFGVCTLLVTMPGLPMFGHGQVEGFTEKYGMEYRKSYWNEQPDWDLVQRHEREIFPLMHKRHVFSDVRNFYLYDFYTPEGYVNENVIAFSNSFDGEHGLVIYNNKFENTTGWVKTSVAYSVKKLEQEERVLEQNSLGHALHLHHHDNYFVIFRDYSSGLEYIRSSKDLHERGLLVALNAYQYHVFLDFREVEDNVWHHYANLNSYLDGRGVPNIDEALKETFLRPIHQSFREIVNQEVYRKLIAAVNNEKMLKSEPLFKQLQDDQVPHLLHEIKNFTQGQGDVQGIVSYMTKIINVLPLLPRLDQAITCPGSRKWLSLSKTLKKHVRDENHRMVLLSWILVHRLGAVLTDTDIPINSRYGMDEWLLAKIMEDTFRHMAMDDAEAYRSVMLIKILTTHQEWWTVKASKIRTAYEIIRVLLQDEDVRNYLQVNRYREVLWFNQEAYHSLIDWMMIIAVIDVLRQELRDEKEICTNILERFDILKKLLNAEKKSEFQVEKLMNALKK
jgi:glycosidase